MQASMRSRASVSNERLLFSGTQLLSGPGVRHCKMYGSVLITNSASIRYRRRQLCYLQKPHHGSMYANL